MAEEEAASSGSASKEEKDVYWVRAGPSSLGIVVAATWMLCKPRQFRKHARLYASCGWDSLVCHPKLSFLHVRPWARALAVRTLDKLVQEVKERPRPIVFATFSGGLKACLYQIFHILDESCEGVDSTLTKYRIVRDCYAGQIHDSSPVDFVSSNGANFASHPTIMGTKKKIPAVTWSAYAVANVLDFFLLPYFESARADMWNITYKAGAWGPVLVLCSKADELAPFEVIQNFSSRLSSLGCKVTLIVWEHCPHVGSLKAHPDEYSNAVTAFLTDASRSYTLKMERTSQYSLQSPTADGSIACSMTSSPKSSMQSVAVQNQTPLSGSPESQTSGDGRVRVWIPSRM